jgi:hypothetical protein
MMGRAHELGSIAPGKLADIVLLAADPLADIEAIAYVQTVVSDGRVFDASAIVSEGPEQLVQRQVNAYNHHDAGVFAETYAADAVVAYRDAFAKNPELHAEIVSRDVRDDVVVDHEHLSGFADERTAEATVTYHVRNGAIAAAISQPG